MGYNYILTVINKNSSEKNLFLNCNTRQAKKCFDALAFALPMNKMGYKKLILSVNNRAGNTVINSASFKELKDENELHL